MHCVAARADTWADPERPLDLPPAACRPWPRCWTGCSCCCPRRPRRTTPCAGCCRSCEYLPTVTAARASVARSAGVRGCFPRERVFLCTARVWPAAARAKKRKKETKPDGTCARTSNSPACVDAAQDPGHRHGAGLHGGAEVQPAGGVLPRLHRRDAAGGLGRAEVRRQAAARPRQLPAGRGAAAPSHGRENGRHAGAPSLRRPLPPPPSAQRTPAHGVAGGRSCASAWARWAWPRPRSSRASP